MYNVNLEKVVSCAGVVGNWGFTWNKKEAHFNLSEISLETFLDNLFAESLTFISCEYRDMQN